MALMFPRKERRPGFIQLILCIAVIPVLLIYDRLRMPMSRFASWRVWRDGLIRSSRIQDFLSSLSSTTHSSGTTHQDRYLHPSSLLGIDMLSAVAFCFQVATNRIANYLETVSLNEQIVCTSTGQPSFTTSSPHHP